MYNLQPLELSACIIEGVANLLFVLAFTFLSMMKRGTLGVKIIISVSNQSELGNCQKAIKIYSRTVCFPHDKNNRNYKLQME